MTPNTSPTLDAPGSNVVSLPISRRHGLRIWEPATPAQSTLQWALSTRGDPAHMIPDGVRDKLRAGLPAALEAVGADLENGPPVGEREVAEFYRLLLKRHKLDEPEPEALALDFICLGEWAIPAFRAAKKWLWIHWRYRRAPTPGDFLVALAAVQDGRAADRAALTELQWKLSTLALKEELQRRFEKWRDTRRSEQTLTQNEGA